MNKKCLVTGSAGFIGSNLSAKLINEGYEIICVDNFNEYYDVNLKRARVSSLIKDTSQIVNLDLRDADKFDSLVKHTPAFVKFYMDGCIHCVNMAAEWEKNGKIPEK